MKKLLPFFYALLTVPIALKAQNEKLTVQPSLANKAIITSKSVSYTTHEDGFPNGGTNSIATKKHPFTYSTKTPLIVGYTWYDLQTNSAVGRRIVLHQDGTASFIWTVCDAGKPYTNRGTGWNYYDGTKLLLPSVTKRLEPVGATNRTGFAHTGGLLGNGKECVMAHKADPYDFMLGKNVSKGSAAWTFIPAGATLKGNLVPGFQSGGAKQALWGRIAIGGSDRNSIHLVAGYNPDDKTKIKGIIAPLVYSRSTDGGDSWDPQSILLPGYDSTRTIQGDAESHSIDANGDTVAIVIGGLGEDLALWKSTDNGDTWKKTYIDSNIFAPSIDIKGGPTDTVLSNDGSMSVVVDPAGKVHVAYAAERIIENGTKGDGKFGVLFADMALFYWNDVDKKKIEVPITLHMIDGKQNGGNGNGEYEIAKWTLSIDSAAGPSARYGNNALLNKPSIAVEGQNIFILFSLPTDGDSTADGQSYRDVWIIASKDGGTTWGNAQNITCTVGEEEAFACLAKRVNSNLHILYQWDLEPGVALQNFDKDGVNEMHYITVDKAKVLAGTAGCAVDGVYEHENSIFDVSTCYPNPATDVTHFDVSMKQNGTLTIEISNSIGQVVYTNSNKFSMGKHTLTVNTNPFTSGLYFYSIKSENAFVSGKMTLVK